MRFAEYVEIRNQSNNQSNYEFLQEIFENKEYNPEGLELNEFISGLMDKIGQWGSGMFGAAKNAGGDVGRSLYNLPGKIADKASEYGSAFSIGGKIKKAQQLQSTLEKINQALLTDPDFAEVNKAGALRGVQDIGNILKKFLEKGEGMKGELNKQRYDRGNLRTGRSSGDASTRAGGFDRRERLRQDAATARDAARAARDAARDIA